MRHLTILVAGLAWLWMGMAHAAAPQYVPLQGMLKDAAGTPITTTVSVRFSLHSSEVGGSELWFESQYVTPQAGLFTVYLGQSSPIDLTTFRDHNDLWLEVQVESDGPMARIRLGSAPFGAYAEYCGSVPLSSLPSGMVVGAQSCATGKVSGVSASGQLVCSNDVSSVVAGPGLAGSGTTGAVTLGLKDCPNGEVLLSGGTGVWGCGSVSAPAGGDVTDVLAGTGISVVNPTGPQPTVSIAPLGVTNSLIADGAVDDSKIAAGVAWTKLAGVPNGLVAVGPVSCADGTVPTKAGAAWTCVPAALGSVTQVLTGAGLTGGPITTTGNISIANGGVTSAMIADGTIQFSDLGQNGCSDGTVPQWSAGAWSCVARFEPTEVNSLLTSGGYATQGWVSSQNFATQVWVNSNFATQAWVSSQSFATQAWVSSQSYATQNWVSSQSYATQAFVTGQDNAVKTWANGAFATQAWVSSQNYAAQSWVSGQNFAAQSWVSAQNYATQAWVGSQSYASQNWVSSQGYATQNWVGSQGYATQSWVSSQGYATQAWVSNQSLDGARLINGTVSGAKLANNTITADQVSATGGVVAWRSGMQMSLSNAANVPAGSIGTASASCPGSTTVPISGGCQTSASSGFSLLDSYPDFVSGNATWFCRANNSGGNNQTLTARVICYSHP